jgi:hypothetical protein
MTLHLVEPNQSVGNLEIGNKAIFPVARKVIEDNSREDLNALSIIYLFQLKPKSSKGKQILGSCKGISRKGQTVP